MQAVEYVITVGVKEGDGGSTDKIRQIYDTLPRLNCGLCGFDACGKFAKAVAEGRASPFGCKQDP
jgi:Na+-translocating ferredoxin:NAD+ oxidoreductase RNF subunit RnfB